MRQLNTLSLGELIPAKPAVSRNKPKQLNISEGILGTKATVSGTEKVNNATFGRLGENE